jgi:predicted Zn-dependent protease
VTAPANGSADRALPPEAAAALEDGLRRYREGDPEGAHEKFGQAYRRVPSDPRIQSWYGMTLVLVEKNSNLGVMLVDGAARTPHPGPDLFINQSRVAMALGQRVRAVRALERGLAAWPDQADLLAAREALGRRKRPVIGFLSRRNWLNRMLGRVQHRWATRRGSKGKATPPDGED